MLGMKFFSRIEALMALDKSSFCENNCSQNEACLVLIWSTPFFGWMVYLVTVKSKAIVSKKGFFKHHSLHLRENWRFALSTNDFIGVHYLRFLQKLTSIRTQSQQRWLAVQRWRGLLNSTLYTVQAKLRLNGEDVCLWRCLHQLLLPNNIKFNHHRLEKWDQSYHQVLADVIIYSIVSI